MCIMRTHRPGSQDPVTEGLTSTHAKNDIATEGCDYDPLVEQMLAQNRDEDLVALRQKDCGTQEKRQESAQIEEKLRVTQQENAGLKQQITQQFEDLGELEIIMGQLESQVDGHEAIIKQQDRRIQEQERTIVQLNARLQQFVQALVLDARYSL